MCDVVGLMAAAAAFTAGMQYIGLTSALIDGMKNSQQIAQIGAAFGPFLLAVISGSGNAAALAFNGANTSCGRLWLWHHATRLYGPIRCWHRP